MHAAIFAAKIADAHSPYSALCILVFLNTGCTFTIILTDVAKYCTKKTVLILFHFHLYFYMM